MIQIEKRRNGSFIKGFSSAFRAFPFISQNRMIRYLVIPVFVNIALLSAIIWFVFIKTYPVLRSLLIFDQWYLHWIEYLAAPVLIILLLIATFFTYSVTGTLLVSPFLDIISIKTEKAFGGDVPDPGFSLKAIWRMLGGMVRLLILVLILNIIILPVNLLPLGSLVYSAVSFFLTAFFCGFQFYDMPLERRELEFREKLLVGRKFLLTVSGTGAAFMLMSFIPVIGFLGVVVSTCGATLAFRELILPAIKTGN